MIKWMLKVCDNDSHKEPFIQHNAKYHCFVGQEKDFNYITSGKSLCGKYEQDFDYGSEITEEDLYFGNIKICQKCLKKYFRLKD